jgi:hypothetical protein
LILIELHIHPCSLEHLQQGILADIPAIVRGKRLTGIINFNLRRLSRGRLFLDAIIFDSDPPIIIVRGNFDRLLAHLSLLSRWRA